MDITRFVGKELDLNYELSKEHTSEGIVILNNDHIYILKVRIKKDQYHEGYSDIIKIDKGDNNITFTSLYHESKESSDNLS